MEDTPRLYKKRIDETREKRRKNRDKFLEFLQEYDLVDERFKTKTRKEILANFEENERTEKSTELYLKIGQELGSIEIKYQELDEIKNKLELMKQKYSDLKKQMVEQNVSGADETTLKLQMQKLINIKEESENVEDEIKNLEDEIANREKEIKEIEETYGEKGDIEEIIQDSEDKQTEGQQETNEIKVNPETLAEYKEKILSERGKIDEIKKSIIDLLDEGIGINDEMKDRIKAEISSTFNKYEAKQEGSLKMKSARYMEDRVGILEKIGYGDERESKSIGGKLLIKGKKADGKYYIIRGKQQLGDNFDDITLQEIGGKPCFSGKKDGKECVIRGNEQLGDWFDSIQKLQDIGGKPGFIAKSDGKWCVMWGNEQYSDKYNEISYFEGIGQKPCYQVKKDGKECVIRGNEQQGDWFDSIQKLQDIGGKPGFIAKRDGKWCVMWGSEQYSDKYNEISGFEGILGKPYFRVNYDRYRGKDEIYDYKKLEIGGKPCFQLKNTKNHKYYVIRGSEQLGNRFDGIYNLQEIGGKPCFKVYNNGKKYLMRGCEQLGNRFDDLCDIQEIGGKPCFQGRKEGKWCVMWGKEQQGIWFDTIYNCCKEIGGRPTFIAKKDQKYCIMRGNEQQGDWFDDIEGLEEIGGKPVFKAKKDGKYCIMRGTEQQGDWFDSTYDLQEIGGKPCFEAKKDGKWCIMWGSEQQGDWFDEVYKNQEIGGRPTFKAKRDGKYCIMRGNEQLGDWFNNGESVCDIEKFIIKYNENQYENTNENEEKGSTQIVEENKSENEAETENERQELLLILREEREKIILDRYQKKLNRDRLLKIISGIETMDVKLKKTLKLEILSDFYAEFEKIISTNEFKNIDKEYRKLKKIERQKIKKGAEWDLLKKEDLPEIVELDEKLLEIGNTAMELENGSRLNIRRLKKAQTERNVLSERQKKILKDLEKIKEEKNELELALAEQTKTYGEKTERPKIKGIVLKEIKGAKEQLEIEKTLKGYKDTYMKIIREKEEYMNDLLNQIETIDFGISEEKKKDVIEKLKVELRKEIEELKKGDDILKVAEETERRLEENKESNKEKMEELERKIEEKNAEIQKIQTELKGEELEGKSFEEIFEIKQQGIKLNGELIKLKEEYEKIKSEWNEKLEKYQGKE